MPIVILVYISVALSFVFGVSPTWKRKTGSESPTPFQLMVVAVPISVLVGLIIIYS